MSKQATLSTNIDFELKEALALFCKKRGLKIQSVVENAIREKMKKRFHFCVKLIKSSLRKVHWYGVASARVRFIFFFLDFVDNHLGLFGIIFSLVWHASFLKLPRIKEFSAKLNIIPESFNYFHLVNLANSSSMPFNTRLFFLCLVTAE